MRALAPRALATLQRRYEYYPQTGAMLLRPQPYTHEQLDDLLYLQEELTHEVLARYDRLGSSAGRPNSPWRRGSAA